MLNYFNLFGLKATFALNEAELRQAYIAGQQQVHPDKLRNQPALERQAAAQRSADLNQGYKLLKDPLLRAQHLLALQGIVVNGENDTHRPDPALLMDVMEWREEVEATENAVDAESAHNKFQAQFDKVLNDAATSFAEEKWDAAAWHVIRLRYLEKTLEALRQKRRLVAQTSA
jgi:molecular chaperone HscB